MTIARPDDVRRSNRRSVLAALRAQPRLSRTELSALTGLSASTVSAITSDLVSEGILRVAAGTETATPRRGRPQVALQLDPAAGTVLVVVLSLNSVSAALVDYAGALVRETARGIVTTAIGREELVEQVIGVAGAVLDPARPPLRTVLAVQGVTDAGEQSLLWSPITPHQDVGFAARLRQAFGAEASVENDGNMIALALRSREPRRLGRDFAAVLLSHGVGMGLVLNGAVFTGSRSSGMEFGHMIHVPGGALCRCGRRGCIEAYAGQYAIWRAASGAQESEPPSQDGGGDVIAGLAERARVGDGPAREAFRSAGRALGFGLGSLFALVDPAPVALVGAGAGAFDLLEQPLREALARTAGGQGAATLPIHVEPDDLMLIREGCAIRALGSVDGDVFAAAARKRGPGPGRVPQSASME